MRCLLVLAGVWCLGLVEQAVVAAPPPDYDFQWTTIGNTGNSGVPVQPYDVGNYEGIYGRGGVNYEYRASRLEITTGQWLEFVNTFASGASLPPWFHRVGPVYPGPTYWGGGIDLSYPGPGFHFGLLGGPNSAMRPVMGISWREAAMYCNWLNNGKSSDLASLLTGAYDTTSWGDLPRGEFSDALTRMPGAKYFLPTLDEALKAMFYDPNRYGDSTGGWWLNKNKSDLPGIPGLPGVGTTTAGMTEGLALGVPLGAYADQQSAYGLWDTSGGASEWTEFAMPPIDPRGRIGIGVEAGGDIRGDAIAVIASSSPPAFAFQNQGFRVYSIVPSGPTLGVLAFASVAVASRKRKSS